MRKFYLSKFFLPVLMAFSLIQATVVKAQNDNCGSATLAMVGQQSVTTSGQTEYWYHFVPSENVAYDLTVSATGTTITFFTGVCGSESVLVASAPGAGSLTASGLAAGTGVFIKFDDQLGADFDLSISTGGGGANSAPTDITLSASSIDENVAAFTVVGDLSSTDPDNADIFTYSLVMGTGDTDNGSFDIVSGNQLTITLSPDYETKNSYSIRVKTADGNGGVFEKAFTITINDVMESGGGNAAPTDIALSATSINENVAINTVIGTLTTTDPDVSDNTFFYELVSGTGDTDNSSFTIDLFDDQLKIAISPDYETKNSYSIRVKTTDAGNSSFEKVFTITIIDVNEGGGSTPQTITFNQDFGTPVYGDDVTLTASASSSLTVSYSVISGPASINGTTLSITGTGSITVQAEQAGDGTYAAATPEQRTFMASARIITVSNFIEDKVYDGTTPATFAAGTFSGVLTADASNVTLSTTGVTAAFADPKAGTNKAVTITGTLTLSGSAAGNYSLTQPTGVTANISAKSITVSNVIADKTYDGTTAATYGAGNLSGVITADASNVSLSTTGVTAGFADPNAGSGKSVNITGSFSLSGSAADNYNLTQPTGVTANISAKSITVSNVIADKTYDGTTDATFAAGNLSGVITADGSNVSLSTAGVTAAFADANAGSGKSVNITGALALSGSAADNYNLTQPTGVTANITPKSITVSNVIADKTYDGTTAATFAAGTFSGVLTADASKISLSTTGVTAAFADPNAGTNKAVTITGTLTLSGSAAGNYSLTQPTGVTATIMQKELTITGFNADKVYDGTPTASLTGSASLAGLIDIDANNVYIVGSPSAAFADANAGTAKLVTITGYTLDGTEAKNNYRLLTTITATIAKANPTISFPAITSKTVGDAPFSLGIATNTSGVPIQIEALPSGILSIADGTATILGGGVVNVTATITETANYAGASATQSICIKPSRPDITYKQNTDGSVDLSGPLVDGNRPVLLWYQVGTNGDVLKATSMTYKVTAEDAAAGSTFYAKAGVVGCASEASNKWKVIITAIEAQAGEPVSLSPNPAERVLQVNGVTKEVQYKIMGMDGRMYSLQDEYRDSQLQVNVHSLSPGIYLMQLADKGRVKTIKFIKK